MLPFCGYSLSGYLQHWLDAKGWIDEDKLPRFFHVNWFRRDAQNRFLWPGFGDNVRVLEWAVKRVHGEAEAKDSPLGLLPLPGGINTEGLGEVDMDTLLHVSKEEWREEAASIRAYYEQLGGVPEALYALLEDLEKRLNA